ncbi:MULTISPECIES: permease [unclassified Nodularia (in: cyanobacteria)]|uniref:permease n=1 Tax=unclassified Nodularia (in: cyanobacteria) TaxID=2656917 RepID=UPI00187F0F48|nr:MULTISPECIES: permease [unclassified Nodularia (in: cyanobacteria)]MBE9199535.1 permease [Nodularia sp. LEGE 06071]MCC2691348.1 permease [Nodularia sp. LEGE 04288]
MNQLNNGFTIFLSLLVEAMPFLLFGVLFSSVLLIFIDERQLVTRMPKNPVLGALAGSLIGFMFPVCECGNVPVARRLLMQGVPTPVAIGFLLAAPTINPIVIWATWLAFRDQPEIVVLRVVFSLLIAVIIGIVFSFQKDVTPLVQPAIARYLKFNPPAQPETKRRGRGDAAKATVPSVLKSGTYILGGKPGLTQRLDPNLLQAATPAASPSKSVADKLRLVLDNVIQELRELGGVMILGSAIAASVQVFAPRELILSLGAGHITSIVVMLILAVVVSVCSTVDSFFALSFASAFSSGSLLAFLVFGPMVDIKSIGLMLTVFNAKTIFYLFALAAQLTFLFSLFINLYVL